MARPRRPYNGVEDITPSDDPWMVRVSPVQLGVRQRTRWESSAHWTYRQPNGQFDPLTYLHVLDAVANIDPDIELRAKNLTEYLNRVRPQFVWDPVTVGKVVSDLCDSFTDVLGEKSGLLERGKDYKGSFYRVHHLPDVARVYFSLREDLMRLSELEITARAQRGHTKMLASPLLECPSLRGEWDGE